MLILYIILALIVLFLAVILIRAALFKPRPEPAREPEPMEFDRDAAVDALAALVRCNVQVFATWG